MKMMIVALILVATGASAAITEQKRAELIKDLPMTVLTIGMSKTLFDVLLLNPNDPKNERKACYAVAKLEESIQVMEFHYSALEINGENTRIDARNLIRINQNLSELKAFCGVPAEVGTGALKTLGLSPVSKVSEIPDRLKGIMANIEVIKSDLRIR